jgi:vacuolar-type H+-ATPase subunit C/Vma6
VAVVWYDVIVRARGLSTRLLGRPALQALAASGDVTALASALGRLGYLPAGAPPATAPAELEGAIRRVAGARLGTLARWCGPRGEVLAVVFEDEDRRSLRALLRGALAGAAPALRLAGLVPTPALPARALEELARLPGPEEVATLLSAFGNPYGVALLPEARSPRPDPFRLATALDRTFAARALRQSLRGDRPLRRFARETIDLENAAAAIVLSEEKGDRAPAERFVPGGRALAAEPFAEAAGAGTAAEAAGRLARAFAGTPYQAALAAAGGAPGSLERALLAVRVRERVRAARRAPLSTEPVLAYVLRLRAEAIDLGTILWTAALGGPRPPRAWEMVSAA